MALCRGVCGCACALPAGPAKASCVSVVVPAGPLHMLVPLPEYMPYACVCSQFYLAINVGSLIAGTVIVYIQVCGLAGTKMRSAWHERGAVYPRFGGLRLVQCTEGAVKEHRYALNHAFYILLLVPDWKSVLRTAAASIN
eukprot:scaffold32994_cov22-Tisochrysis_lutea.AAC.1